jgi:hypothetical protein
VERFPRTPEPPDPPRERRSPTLHEPEFGGEIAVHRQAAGARGAALAQLTIPAAPADASAPAAPEAPAVHPEDFEGIEDYLRAYLEDQRFRSAHPLACGRWVVAWEMLWCADSKAKVIDVGHRACDAMAAFSSSLIELCTPLAMDAQWPELLTGVAPPQEPLEGLLTVTEAYRQQLGEERFGLLHALVGQWRGLLERVLRHEDAPAVDERLTWEDGRRLVLFTALVMVETDRSFA